MAPQIVGTLLVFAASALLLGHGSSLLNRRRLQRLAATRKGEGWASFARAFETEPVDPELLREVYVELQAYHEDSIQHLPLRATDRLEADLGIDAGDLIDLAAAIAHRTGVLMERPEENPLHGKVHTVGDLVLFLSHQRGTTLSTDAERHKDV